MAAASAALEVAVWAAWVVAVAAFASVAPTRAVLAEVHTSRLRVVAAAMDLEPTESAKAATRPTEAAVLGKPFKAV